MQRQIPLFIKAWFAVDLFLALFPPFHWIASEAPPILGTPASLVYLAGICLFTLVSVVVAYLYDGNASLWPTEER